MPYNGIWQQLFEKTLSNNPFFPQKHGKHDDHTMIMVWIMENMVIIPRSCPESWRPCQETWPPCRHHGMIMTMFRYDHGMIMAWQPCFSNPGRTCYLYTKVGSYFSTTVSYVLHLNFCWLKVSVLNASPADREFLTS